MITHTVTRTVARGIFANRSKVLPPRTGLLLYLRTPNGTGAAAGKYVATAGSASIFAALGSDWYTDVATPKALTAAEILALASVNDYHILFSAAKGLAIYDPYTTAQADIDRAHQFYRVSIYADDVPTSFFNGLDTTGMTSYTGGPTYAPDHLGVLRSPGAGLPALQGMRLATTVADGAVLGPELCGNGGFDTDTVWQKEAGWSIDTLTGKAVAVSGADSSLYQQLVTDQNDICVLILTVELTAGTITIRFGSNTGQHTISSPGTHTLQVTDKDNGIFKLYKSTTFAGTVDSVSIKKVFPTYYDTTITGEPILPSVNQATRASGTVLDGSELGPELITVAADREFSSDTGWWIKGSGWAIADGVASNNATAYAQLTRSILTVGVKYLVTVTVVEGSGRLAVRLGTTNTVGTATGPGTYSFIGTCITNTSIAFLWETLGGSIDNISVKEVLPALTNVFTPSTTFKKYTRTNPATDMPGYLCEPARTNKVTCRKANPVDTTNVTKAGDAAAVLSVVDDTAALTAAGLMGYPDSPCTTGKVYKLDNSSGTGFAFVALSGAAGNTNAHSLSVYARKSGVAVAALKFKIDVAEKTIPVSTGYIQTLHQNVTPGASSRLLELAVGAGSIIHFILPQLEEGPFCTSPIAKLQDGIDPLTAISRAGTVLSFPTAGKIRSNNMAFRMIVVPRTNTTFTNRLFSMYSDVSNKIRINGFSNDGNCEVWKTIAGVDSTLKFNSSSLVNGVGLDLLFIQSSTSGMVGSARKYTSGVWSAWSSPVTNATAGGKANMPAAPTYQLGSMGGIDQFAGNISLFDTLLIPEGITDPLAWAKAQWGLPA